MTELKDFKKKYEKFIERAELYCQQNDMEKNEHGVYIYVSTNGFSSINLPAILQNYADECAKESEELIEETMDTEVDKDFDIRTLDDKMKYGFLVENFDKLKLIELETLIK